MVRAALRGEGFEIRLSAVGVGSMSDDTSRRSDANHHHSDEAALSARLRSLGNRLDQQRASQPSGTTSGPRPGVDRSAMARGLRLSTELVAGVLVGAVIGYWLDRWLGISPWGFIVFVLLGFVAGIVNVMRAAGLSGKPGGGAT